MGDVNLGELELTTDEGDPDGFAASYLRLGPLLGATKLGATVYGLPPGQSICPYHYEYGNEEWLLVLDGEPRLRTPAGERTLRAGDLVCFPEGPEGAHKVTAGEQAARVLLLSTKSKPDVSVYPDSGKIGVFPGRDEDTAVFRRDSAVEYLDGEL